MSDAITDVKKLFVAATRQNDGKTTVSLGIMAALGKRLQEVGFIKPVGQRYIEEDGHKVDEDSLLMKRVFDLSGHIKDMSPLAIEKGFTENYILEGYREREKLENMFLKSFKNVARNRKMVVIEGTGHAGVGSVLDFSNAAMARLLGSKVLMVTKGGIGNPIDEVMLNKALFDSFDVEIIGVIINKVMENKYSKINKLVRQGLKHKGIEVLGVVPYQKILSSITIRQVADVLESDVISGHKNVDNMVEKIIVGAMEPHNVIDYFENGTLLITPGDREDIVLAALSSHVLDNEHGSVNLAGIVLTCGFRPHKTIQNLMEKSGLPILMVKDDTYSVVSQIHDLIVKISPHDQEKIKVTKALIEKYVDIDGILERL